MTDDTSALNPANSNFAVLAAIAELGLNATPAAIAEEIGIAYSTVNPKLRAWESAGLAERFRHDSQTLWRLTDAGRASTATPPQFAAAETMSEAALGAGPTAASAVPRPPSGQPCDDNGDDQRTAPPSPPLPVAGDTASCEPATAGTAIDGALNGDDEPSADSEVASAVAAGHRVDPGTIPAPPAPAADETAEPAEDQDTDPDTAAPSAKRRRPKGALKASALAVLQDNPDREYKIGELKKLIDRADADTGYPQASEGAVCNALDNLARDGQAVKVEDRTAATFQIAPAAD